MYEIWTIDGVVAQFDSIGSAIRQADEMAAQGMIVGVYRPGVKRCFYRPGRG